MIWWCYFQQSASESTDINCVIRCRINVMYIIGRKAVFRHIVLPQMVEFKGFWRREMCRETEKPACCSDKHITVFIAADMTCTETGGHRIVFQLISRMDKSCFAIGGIDIIDTATISGYPYPSFCILCDAIYIIMAQAEGVFPIVFEIYHTKSGMNIFSG